MKQIVRLELQFFNGCPHAPAALALVKKFQEEYPETEVKYTRVDNERRAKQVGFRGSPTILINGEDLFGISIPGEPHLACRFYPGGIPLYDDFKKMVFKLAHDQ